MANDILDSLYVTPQETGYGAGATLLASMAPALTGFRGSRNVGLAAGLGSALLGGLAAYQARQEADRQNAALTPFISQLGQAQSVEDIGKIASGEAFPQRLSPLAAALMLEQRKSDTEQKRALDKLRTIAQLEFVQDQARLRPGSTIDIDATGQLVLKQDVEDVMPVDIKAEPIIPGVETMVERQRRLIAEARRQGIRTDTGINEYIKRVDSAQALETKSLYQSVSDARDKAAALGKVIDTASSGIAGAGETGGPGLIRSARELASGLYAQLSPLGIPGAIEEREQRAAQAELASIKADIINSNKFPGAISNVEFQALIGSGPSLEKTYEENAAILGNMRAIKDRLDQYTNFYDTMIEQGIPANTIQKKWQEYRDNNRLFDPVTKKVRAEVPSWREYFAQEQMGAPVEKPLSEWSTSEIEAALAAER